MEKINIAVKIIPLSYNDRMNIYDTRYQVWRELKTLDLVSDLVYRRIIPNMPLVYSHYVCNFCQYENENIIGKNNKMCLLILNELSDIDLKHWIIEISKKKLKTEELENIWYNVFFQIWAAIFCIQKHYQLIHNDLHWSNILVDYIDTKGYWIYIIDNIKYYVPNKGFLLKLWDFGKSFSVTQFKSTRSRSSSSSSNKKTYTDIDKIHSIYSCIKHSDLIKNKNVFPKMLVKLIKHSKGNNIRNPNELLKTYMSRYMHNMIGEKILEKDKDKMEFCTIPDILTKGEIVGYEGEYVLIENIYKFSVNIITKKQDAVIPISVIIDKF